VKASPQTNDAGSTRKIQMQKNTFYRSFLTIGTIAALWSAPALLRAAELHPLVVIGIPLDKVAAVHPTPEYPRAALALGIDGKVRIKMKVQDGRIVEAAALAGSPMLGYFAKVWILRNWKFRPEISGVFTIPISYKRQA
jgi:outer membrane biosynthesis protein TonB